MLKAMLASVTDQPVHPVDGDMGLVAVEGDRDIDRLGAVGADLRLGILDSPAPIDVLLTGLGGLVRPDLRSEISRYMRQMGV